MDHVKPAQGESKMHEEDAFGVDYARSRVNLILLDLDHLCRNLLRRIRCPVAVLLKLGLLMLMHVFGNVVLHERVNALIVGPRIVE